MSVVMPVLNEQKHLAASVGQILRQEYGGELELVIALGPSKDATDRIARKLAFSDSRIKLVRNPTGRTPAGLNAAGRGGHVHKGARGSFVRPGRSRR